MKLMKRAKHVILGTDGKGEDGASNLEILVWMVVVMGIAGVLWIFRGKIMELITNITDDIGGWDTSSKWQ